MKRFKNYLKVNLILSVVPVGLSFLSLIFVRLKWRLLELISIPGFFLLDMVGSSFGITWNAHGANWIIPFLVSQLIAYSIVIGLIQLLFYAHSGEERRRA